MSPRPEKIPGRKPDSEAGCIFENFTPKQGNSLKILAAGTRNHGVSLPPGPMTGFPPEKISGGDNMPLFFKQYANVSIVLSFVFVGNFRGRNNFSGEGAQACEQGVGKERGRGQREPAGTAKVFDFQMPVIYVMFKLTIRVASATRTAYFE